MNIRYMNQRQIYEMDKHKYLRSKELGYDIGDPGRLEWVTKYAEAFRSWADNLPSKCIRCDYCCYSYRKKVPSECPYPFNNKRIRLIESQKIDPHSSSPK